MLALLLMFGSNRWQVVTRVRSALAIVVAPVHYLVNWPFEFVNWADDYLTGKHKLLADNLKLHAELFLLQAKLQKLITLEKENAQLRALLSSSVHVASKVLVAQVLAVNSDPFDQQIILDKGKQQGVYVGQPVLGADGVVGQVIAVDSITSRALLVTSSRSAVPVQDSRSGVRAIAAGGGSSGDLQLLYISDTVDIKLGDLLITSGLGLKFPIGYPVGKVATIKHPKGERFAAITVTPSAKLNRSRQVLLIWPEQSKFTKQVKEMLAQS